MNVNIIGTGLTAFGKFPDRSVTDLTNEALGDALADAGCDPSEVGFVAFGNAVISVITGQAMIQGQLALAATPLAGSMIINVENACATSSSAVQTAVMAVRSGLTDVAVAIGVEKMAHPDKQRAFEALGAALDVTVPVAEGSTRASVFMSLYAAQAREYMARSGAPAEAFAEAAAQAFANGALNPKAQYRTPYTVEQILDARVIADPLTLLMCSPVGDGAAVVVVANEAGTRRATGDPVRILGGAVRSGRPGDGGDLVRLTASAAYDRAGITTNRVDVVELHDAASSAKPIILEELGFADHGAGWKRILNGDTGLGGSLPVNPSGGLVSRGHPIGATGCAQLVELADQLRGRARDRQVPNARIAVAETLGGAIETEPYTAAACAVTVLGAI